MIHTHTMSQLKTVQEPLILLAPTANIPNNTTTIPNNLPTTAAPTNSNSVVISASTLNYIKIIPLTGTATAQTIRVTGWNKSIVGTTTYYVPQLLFYGSIAALGATSVAINGIQLFPAVTINKTQGDAKIYNATSISSTAFILVDTLGCEQIEIEYFATGSGSATGGNAFYGAM